MNHSFGSLCAISWFLFIAASTPSDASSFQSLSSTPDFLRTFSTSLHKSLDSNTLLIGIYPSGDQFRYQLVSQDIYLETTDLICGLKPSVCPHVQMRDQMYFLDQQYLIHFERAKNLIVYTEGTAFPIPLEAVFRHKTRGVLVSNTLLYSHNIRYVKGEAALRRLFHVEKDHTHFENRFVGFGPVFKSRARGDCNNVLRNGLAALQCNQHEVSTIAALINGHALNGHSATTEKFRLLAEHTAILHIASHATIKTGTHELHFSDHSLTSEDIRRIRLKNRLVVLSACRTANNSANNQMDLANAFLNAGSRSVVASLWEVDDCTTSKLMILFYQYLHDGLPVDMALRQAKLAYISTAYKAQQHPSHWAGFVLLGANDPVF